MNSEKGYNGKDEECKEKFRITKKVIIPEALFAWGAGRRHFYSS